MSLVAWSKEGREKSSMLYWYPRIKDLDIPQPKTILVEVESKQWFDLVNGEGRPPETQQLELAAEEMGYPLFLRTDHTSGKHDAKSTCFVSKTDELKQHAYNLVEFSCMEDLPFNAFVVREFIKMNSAFTAFNGLPISCERRYFVRDGNVECHHPYWPEASIEFRVGTEVPDGWQTKLKLLNMETPVERPILLRYAFQVAQVLEGYWSVDFCHGVDGAWYLIDCALGDASFHPECEFHTTRTG